MNSKIIVTLGLTGARELVANYCIDSVTDEAVRNLARAEIPVSETGTVKLTEDCYADQDVIDAILYGDK